ncbi:hypothetical protein HZA96_04090 [Candidatus Woesearchaeota archaeon]|nr:hypothetical protein [Candidatus Woesearchaeota archaeon]
MRHKKAEMMTLETVAEAVLVAAAFIVLLILAVGIYQLFFHDSTEQAAKESFHSLLATLDIMADNKPIERPFKLDSDYAIIDTTPELCEFVEEVKGDNKEGKNIRMFDKELPQECKTSDCLCLCKSSAIGLCNEIIECKPITKKATQTRYQFFSKMDPLFMQKYVSDIKQYDSTKTYDCVYIKSFDKVYPLKIVKLNDEITFCSNNCNVNDPMCCTSPGFMPIIDKNFAELQKIYDACREETIAKTNPTDYFKLLKQGAYNNQRIDFLPAIAQQKAIYRYYFDAQGNLDETNLGEKINLDTPFIEVKENLIESCDDISNLNKNGNLKKEFVGADGMTRRIETGKCPETVQQYYLRIVRLGQQKELLFIDNNEPKTHFDLISTNAADLELFNDELYVIPKSDIAERSSDQYKQAENAKSIILSERETKNKKINLNDKSSQEITLDFGILLQINNHKIDATNKKMEPDTIADTIKKCDEAADASNFGEYSLIQEATQDTTTGNNFKTVIDYGKCYYKTPEEVEAQRKSSNICNSGNAYDKSDCQGSTDNQENQELSTVAHNYLRVIKEDEDGSRVLLFSDMTDTPSTILEPSIDYNQYAYYYYNNELYILEPESIHLDLLHLYNYDLNYKTTSAIHLVINLNDLDMTKIKKQTNCKQQLAYPFFQGSNVIINADGKLQLNVNNAEVKSGSFNNLPIFENIFVCILKDGKPIGFSGKSISYTTNQMLSFVDIGIDRLCVKIE